MCFDFQTSIASYLAGILAGIAALYTGQIILGWFILCYCQIQLAEAVIWYGIDSESTTINRVGTTMLKYLLATHLIGLGLGIYFAIGVVWPLIFGILFFLAVAVLYALRPSPTTTYPSEKSGRLEWTFPYWWYMFVYVAVAALIFKFMPSSWASKLFIVGAYTLTLIWSILYNKSVGSMWCFLSAVAAPIIVAGNNFLTK